MDLTLLAPDPILLLFAVFLDGLFGDPVFAWHPIRLMGGTLSIFERMLRRLGLDGYAGGCMLMLLLSAFWIGLICGLAIILNHFKYDIGWIFQAYIIFSMIALKDLCRHGMAIDRAADPDGARRAVSMLVGRDTERMDAAACRRAGMESLSENAVDGFVSPIFWYAVLGLPGIVFFKVVSTMDLHGGIQDTAIPLFRMVRRPDGRPAQLCPGKIDLSWDGSRRFPPARMFRPQGAPCRLATARARSRPEFRLERGNGLGRAAAASRGSHLAGWKADN